MTNKQVLQLSLNRKEYFVEELEQNLRTVLINFNADSITANISNIYWKADKRYDLVKQFITKKGKTASTTTENQKEKRQKQNQQPELIGK